MYTHTYTYIYIYIHTFPRTMGSPSSSTQVFLLRELLFWEEIFYTPPPPGSSF